ncbi:chromosome partitioning protein [Methylobacterium sp. D54C]
MARAPSTPPAASGRSAIAPAGARLLCVVQETGGVGKSTVARALAEAVEDAPVYEIESSTRLLELGERVRHFPIRADSAELMKTGGEAAMVEFNPVINALVRETRPAIVDIGANGAAPFLAAVGRAAGLFARRGRGLGVLFVAAAPESAYDSLETLTALAQPWAAKQFVVANEYRDTVDIDRVRQLVPGASVTRLPRFSFAAGVRPVVDPLGLALIPQLDEEKLAEQLRDKGGEPDYALAATTVGVLAEFRLEAMRAVRESAEWLIG